MPRLFLIDGSSYIYRAFFALPYLSNSRGFPTNAIYGFTPMLLKVIREWQPDLLAVVLDSKELTFRHEIYSDYKATRPTMPSNLACQIPYIINIVEGLRIPLLVKEGFEADDIIGTIAKDTAKKGIEVTIASCDKDMLQLVGEGIWVLDTMKEKSFREADVISRFGVKPYQLPEIVGLCGDASDNIPGVPGVGEKTAIKLIKEFGSIENLLGNLKKVSPKSLQENLEKFSKQAILSKDLATIDTQVPLSYDLKELSRNKPDLERLGPIFKELEFWKFWKELSPPKRESLGEYKLILEKQGFKNLLGALKQKGEFAFDVKTAGEEILGISFSFNPGEAFYVSLTHLKKDLVLSRLQPLLEDPEIKKFAHDIKQQYLILSPYQIPLKGRLADTMIASYLLNPERHTHSLEDIALEHLEHHKFIPEELTPLDSKHLTGLRGKKALPLSEMSLEKLKDYACEDGELIYRLGEFLLSKVEEEGLGQLFHEIEMPLSLVLAHMEVKGVRVSVEILKEMSLALLKGLQELEEEIFEIAGERFNINSSQKLSKILFERLKLPKGSRRKTGFSTDQEVLSKLSELHPLPAKVLLYRNLKKLSSTYVDALPKLINPKTGRIHTSYNQTITATGRLSSSNPNLQNIPIRTPWGKRIRQAFIADEGFQLLSADYSQIELRILAHLSEDETLVGAFLEDSDIHTLTASEIFGISKSLVTPEMRRQAKIVNFGIIYGMSPYGLGKELGIRPEEAQAYINNYFRRYCGVKRYLDQILEEVGERGYVTTILGRRRFIPQVKNPDRNIRQQALRTAINTPFQGSAADLIKLAMIRIFERLKGESVIIMQVHDELVFEVAEDELEEVRKLIREEMEGVEKLRVPLKVEIGSGKNWDEAR